MTRSQDRSAVQEPEVLSYDSAELATATVFAGPLISQVDSSRRVKKTFEKTSARRIMRQLTQPAANPPAPIVRSYDRDELTETTVFTGVPSVSFSSRRSKSAFAPASVRRVLGRIVAG